MHGNQKVISTKKFTLQRQGVMRILSLVTKLMEARVSENVPRRQGRPRKHATDAKRRQAYRDRELLTKITIDVPDALTDHLKDYASMLREINIDFMYEKNDIALILNWKGIQGEDGLHVRLRNGTLSGEVRALKRDKNGKIEVFKWEVISKHQKKDIVQPEKDLNFSSYKFVYAEGICVNVKTARVLCEVALLSCFREHKKIEYFNIQDEIKL